MQVRSTLLIVLLLAFQARTLAVEGVLVGGSGDGVVRLYGYDGAYQGDLIDAGGVSFGRISGIAVAPNGDIFVSSSVNNQVVRYYDNLQEVQFLTNTSGAPGALRIGPDNRLYVCGGNSNTITRYDVGTNAYLGAFTSGNGITGPLDVAFDADSMYVASTVSNNIQRINLANGQSLGTIIASPTLRPTSLRVSDDGSQLLVSSFTQNAVLRYNLPGGAAAGAFASGGAINGTYGQLRLPNGDILVCSQLANAVLRYDANGVFLGTFASGNGLLRPERLALIPEPCAALLSLLPLCSRRRYTKR